MLALANARKRPTVFTFITEKEGSTIIEQFSGRDVVEATLRWYKGSETHPGEPLEGIEEAATPVTSVEGVWCTGGHDPGGKFFLTHIVATKTTAKHDLELNRSRRD
jgi:hypothetical protein